MREMMEMKEMIKTTAVKTKDTTTSVLTKISNWLKSFNMSIGIQLTKDHKNIIEFRIGENDEIK